MKELFKTSRFSRDIKKVLPHVQKKAYEISLKLIENPLDQSLNIKHLTGFKKVYRVVILADYRMIFTFDEFSVTLYRIAHRKDIYKSLEI
jgi:mRNA-degrading endonuclease RelE of RelBE toxin-antitoxin system